MTIATSLLFVGTMAGESLGFTQIEQGAAGHDVLTVQAAALAEVWPVASEAFEYHANSREAWSAVMGNRWVDLGGYNVLTQKKCWLATVQDADDVQYAHALRKYGDTGLSGLKRAHRGLVSFIYGRFRDAVRAPDEPLPFSDGGKTVGAHSASKPHFFLGMALHALQDSFSSEHTKRSEDGTTILDIKTYVDTPGVARHATRKTEPDKFRQLLGVALGWLPNKRHGDYLFLQDKYSPPADGSLLPDEVLKDSAKYAIEATKELIEAFEEARRDKSRTTERLNQFYQEWLVLDPNPEAGPTDSTVADPQKAEAVRSGCLDKTGRQKINQVEWPAFCWGKCVPGQ